MARPAVTSQSAFIEAALAFIDARGVEELSLRSLGQAMGISHATIYRHFESKESLLEALIDDQLGAALAETDLATDPTNQLINIASSLRRHFNDHPNLLRPFINGKGQGENALKLSLATLKGLKELGLSPNRISHWLRILENYVIGGLVYDFAAAPEHLTIRAFRLNALFELSAIAGNFSEAKVARENEEAFREGLSLLLSAAKSEGENASSK